MRPIFTPSLAMPALCAILTAGCLFDNGKEKTASPFVGLPLDSLRGAVQLMMRDGNLLVANRDKNDPGIAVVDTATGKITAYYLEQLPPSGMAATTDNRIIITETDFQQGAVSVLDLAAKSLQKSALPFGSDNAVSAADGKVFLLDRATGVITGFTGHAPGQNVVVNAQTGPGSNPYDICVANGLAFIPRYNLKSLLVLEADSLNGGSRDSIDLGDYASQNPVDSAAPAPRMAWTTFYGGAVFVAMQRLNYQYQPTDTSLVAVIDPATRQVSGVIPLRFRNPIAAHADGGTWYVIGIGGYGDAEGGVEKIDLAGRSGGEAVLTEASLSADVFDFVPASDHTGYASYSSDFGVTTRVKKVSF